MSIFIGGCIALILGIIGIIIWWYHFVAILQGIVPIMLIFAGALAVYLSYDQLKAWMESRKKDEDTIDVEVAPAASSDLEALKKENEELKRKLEEQNKKIDEAVKSEPAFEKAADAETKTKTAAKDKEAKDETK